MFRGSFYLPKGGTFYLQVDGVSHGPIPPWHLTVTEMGEASAVGAAPPTSVRPEGVFHAPAVLAPASSTNLAPQNIAVGNPVTPPVAPAPMSTAPVVNLTEDQTRAVVMIEGDNTEGTGFLIKTAEGPCVVTNIHVIAGNPNIRILTNTGAQIAVLGLKGASDRDLAMFSIQDAHYSYLELNTDISNTVQPGDDVITPGNSEGGEVVLNTHGTVLGVGPGRIEFTNPIYHGNSGGPVFHTKSGKVIGVVTQAMKVDVTDDLDKASFASRTSAITASMRYFGLRLDTVPKWEVYDMVQFQTQTTFLEQFHQQSRRLDSYLNSSAATDTAASGNNDDNSAPDSKLYLTDDKIRKAHEEFMEHVNGADGAEKLDAFRSWLFELNSIADSNMDPIQDMNNFYTFNQQRAREEIAYRKALRKELDGFGDDVSRAESLGRKY
jgi:hypothetical protein